MEAIDRIDSEDWPIRFDVLGDQARIAELERELAAAHEAIAHRDNEIHSLQTSLDLALIRPEPAAPRQESDDSKDSRIEFLQSALDAAEAECTRLIDEARGRDEKHRTETDGFSAVIADITMRAMVAEQQAAILERSRSELVDGAGTLLKTLDSRDASLRRTDHKIKSLRARIAVLEAQAALPKPRADDLSERERTEWAELARALPKLISLRRQTAKANGLSPSRLLASTIAF